MLAKYLNSLDRPVLKIMVHPIAPFAVCYLIKLCSAADEGRGQVTLPPRGQYQVAPHLVPVRVGHSGQWRTVTQIRLSPILPGTD